MIRVSVKLDVNKLRREFRGMDKEINKAAARGLNRGIDAGATTAGREVSAASKIKVREVRKRMTVRGAHPDYLIAELHAHPYSPNLAAFRATENAKGVAASAWERRKTYRHAFILRGKVVTRTTDKRTPLKGLRGPSVPRIFMRREIVAKIEQVAINRFRTEFEREVTRRLR